MRSALILIAILSIFSCKTPKEEYKTKSLNNPINLTSSNTVCCVGDDYMWQAECVAVGNKTSRIEVSYYPILLDEREIQSMIIEAPLRVTAMEDNGINSLLLFGKRNGQLIIDQVLVDFPREEGVPFNRQSYFTLYSCETADNTEIKLGFPNKEKHASVFIITKPDGLLTQIDADNDSQTTIANLQRLCEETRNSWCLGPLWEHMSRCEIFRFSGETFPHGTFYVLSGNHKITTGKVIMIADLDQDGYIDHVDIYDDESTAWFAVKFLYESQFYQ